MADPDVNGEVAPEDRELRVLLGDAHTIAVVGLSSKPDRPSFERRRLPPGTRLPDRAGEPEGDRGAGRAGVSRRSATSPRTSPWTWSTCSGAPRTRRTSRGTRSRSARRVLWLQAGIVNDEAYRIATEAGLEVIMGVCIRATIRRLDTTEG